MEGALVSRNSPRHLLDTPSWDRAQLVAQVDSARNEGIAVDEDTCVLAPCTPEPWRDGIGEIVEEVNYYRYTGKLLGGNTRTIIAYHVALLFSYTVR